MLEKSMGLLFFLKKPKNYRNGGNDESAENLYPVWSFPV